MGKSHEHTVEQRNPDPPKITFFETVYEFLKQLFCHELDCEIRYVNGRLYTKF